jgi:hypothetical protein
MPEAPPLDRTVVEVDSFLFQRRLTRNMPKESEALKALDFAKIRISACGFLCNFRKNDALTAGRARRLFSDW